MVMHEDHEAFEGVVAMSWHCFASLMPALS